MVSPTQLSVVRMIPIARRIAKAAGGELAVLRLLNRYRGWDATHTPVDDAHLALATLADRFGPLPVSLVGHSLGGRAALLSAGHDAVRSVAALAPWVYPNDVAPGIAGTRVLIVHGDRDRVASPVRAARLAQRLDRHTDVDFVLVEGGRHGMLRHHHRFDDAAARFAVETLLGAPREESRRRFPVLGFGKRRRMPVTSTETR